MPEILVLENISEISRVSAEKFIEIGNRAINQNGRFTVALAGGSTPKALYRLLATEEFRNRIDWGKVFFFFGDERSVLPDDVESNFRMANENLLKVLQIAENQIFRWRTELNDAGKVVGDYEKSLKEFFDLRENEFPRFDLILLGMGGDGHTASLFPLTDALRESEKIAVANDVEKLGTKRFTLTFPVFNNAANVIFLVSGADKAETLKKVLEGERKPDEFPSQNIKLKRGKLIWLVDENAARFLNEQ